MLGYARVFAEERAETRVSADVRFFLSFFFSVFEGHCVVFVLSVAAAAPCGWEELAGTGGFCSGSRRSVSVSLGVDF